MIRQRSMRIVFFVLLALLFSGCGGNIRQEEAGREETPLEETVRGVTPLEETVRGVTPLEETVRVETQPPAPQNKKMSYDIPETRVKKNVYLAGKNVGGKLISDVKKALVEYATKIDKAPVNATITKTWTIKPGKAGRRLNVEKTASALLKARQGRKVGYVFEKVQPAVTHVSLKKNIRVIGKYTTVLLDSRVSRVNNIRLASDRINNTVLKPGEEFSFNRTVGRRTAAKGYEEAPIIVKGPWGPMKKNAKGGGICQVSTTLYNAVEEAGLRVTERQMHSKDVGYVPKGEDATVSFGSVDFKFVNSRQNPVMIKLTVGGRILRVRILENTSGR